MNNKILIVDDEYEILKLLETVLEKRGLPIYILLRLLSQV